MFNLNYHFVWCSKYRHSWLDTVEDTLTEAIHDSLRDTEAEVYPIHISPDHVHLFVSAPPTTAPVELVRRVKSISARRLWLEHRDDATTVLGRWILGTLLLRRECRNRVGRNGPRLH